MGRLREIVCDKPAVLARFWAAMLDGYAVRAYDEAEIARLASLGLTPETDPTVMVDGPGPILCFQHVPSRHYENNRIHFDIATTERPALVAQAMALGARLQREEGGYAVLTDPEGNQFCVVGAA